MKKYNHAHHTLKTYCALAVLLVLLSACAGTRLGGAPPTVKIGLIAPFEGLHRPLGYEALFAVKLALLERNDDGGINGHQIELVALNDFDAPAEALVQAKALVADPDVLGLVGHLSAEATAAAMPVYREANLAASIPWTARPLERPEGVVNVAATSAETLEQLETLVQKQGYYRITTLSDRQIGLFPPDSQAIVFDTEAVTAGEMVLTLRENGVTQPLFGQVDVGSPQLVQVAEQSAAGLIYVSPGPDPADSNEMTKFVEAYQSIAGFPPGPRAVLAYDANNVLLDAIEQAFREQGRQPARAEISAVINRIERRGLSGEIVFDTRGQRVNAPIWVYQISEEGRYPGALVAPQEK
jgi:branched-chain amino acid transport system substrate-binding protein